MRTFNLLRDESGNALVEFAVASLVIFTMAIGAIDFGRMYYTAIAIAAAANAGSSTGVYSQTSAQDTEEMSTVANAALADVDGASATAEKICSCPDAPTDFSVDCDDGSCTGYGLPRLYIRTRVEKTFSTFGKYPTIPKSTDIDLSNYMRVR